MKRDKYDKVFSDLIRERADWTCENCSRQFHHNRAGLHCSHVYGRRKMSVRYDMDNAMAHCVYCHRHLGENPIMFALHYIYNRGQGKLDLLIERERQIKKWEKPSKKTGYKGEKEYMYKHYQSELTRLLDLRKSGKEGWIEVTNWGI
jgi:hypothetical protein